MKNGNEKTAALRVKQGESLLVESKAKPLGNQAIREIGHATRWKPGQSGNPAGPPKRHVQLSMYIKRFLAMSCAEFKCYRPKTVAESVARQIVRDASRGRFNCIETILNRTEGAVTQKVAVEHEAVSLKEGLERLAASGWRPLNPMFSGATDVMGQVIAGAAARAAGQTPDDNQLPRLPKTSQKE